MGKILDTKGPLGVEKKRTSFVLVGAEYTSSTPDGVNPGVHTAPGDQVSIELDHDHLDNLIEDLIALREEMKEQGRKVILFSP